MKIVILFDRFIKKIKRGYRKYIFRKSTGCPHSDFTILGNMTLINQNIKIGHHVTIYPDVMFYGDGLIEIGDNCDIGNGTVIYASKESGVFIGNNTLIGAYSYIIDTDHGSEPGMLICKQKTISSPVFIGNDVWLSAGCKILRGSVIKDGAVVGAQAVVKGEIEENAIAVGVPAKVIKHRGE